MHPEVVVVSINQVIVREAKIEVEEMIAFETIAVVVTIEVVMMIIKATVEGAHRIVGTLVIATSEKKVVDEIIAEDVIMIVIIAVVVVMILKAEKEDIDELKIPVERQDINAMNLRQVTGREEHERIGVKRFPSKL
jgi:hypothetical protein